ncbi:tetraacyldisaccharide 4'-kinase [Legionella norrlandica]|uniref:Tetraacyldisaccharide 4'-kinase n=1 Tax=Legionella norrlandica TaxID=1498499 RepID=A0A0A2SS29_9GAMM|nr:tetraacyldisaccharide 4'-kinase [Legionella norrlandica]KGP63572.1 tetraacyldisaccharide 4'-kinase [Legionella norrlandica]
MSFIVDKIWYGKHFLQWILFPFSWLYSLLIRIRQWYLQRFCQQFYPIPIIVVGNITVGGVGKTPLVIELAKRIQQKGLKVGVVSRGYRSKIKHFPYEVQFNDCAEFVGDEPLMIARTLNCPVVIAPKRTQAVSYLLGKHSVQLIISDDGLQHYRMGRSIEIAVIDGTRGLGNRLCLPAGPLREPDSRLKQVDFVIVNEGNWTDAYSMKLVPNKIIKLATGEEVSIDLFTTEVAAIAGIGNPQRFYSTLSQLGIKFKSYSYPDHYQFKLNDLNYGESQVIMTEKDAVKCSSFSSDKLFYLSVEAKLDDSFWEALWSHQQLQGYC